MQAELNDKIREKTGIRQIARTAFVVALVCFAMPFVTVVNGETAASFSIWQFAASDFQYSEIGYQLPLNAVSMIIASRVFAWATMVFAAFGLVLLFNNNRATKGSDNTLPSLIAALLGVAFSVLIYFYIGYLLHTYINEDVTMALANGGIAQIAAFTGAALFLLLNRVKNRTKLATILIFLAIPLTIYFGMLFLGDRKYYFISLLVMVETILPFMLIFENRKPEARELVVLSVVAAIGVVGRAAFFMVPYFKPVTAIVIIAGICFGPEAGFLTGALMAFVSNFFFGQGPWTPWQMFSFGIIGFVSGLLVRKGKLSTKRLPLAIYGGFMTLFVYGFLMDTYSVLTMNFVSSWLEVLAIYISGFPVNVIHASATIFFLSILAKPLTEKIDRVKKKYGLMEPGENLYEKKNR
ncbi:MAG TPA: ECF transporter S component [Clostridiales bacterium]|nr:ECF transporter S component [Clostridiales bacterium]